LFDGVTEERYAADVVRSVKKPIISVDDLEDSGDEAPSPAMDLAASAFAVRNAANALVTESASIRGTFIWFHEHIAMSLDRMTEVLVKEQAAAQRDRFASFKLLERIAEALERLSPRQAGVVPTEGPVAGGTEVEAGPSEAVVELIRWAQTPLFLPSDENMEPSDESYIDEAKGSGSEEGSEEGSADENADVEEDVDEDDEMDIDQTLRD
jgi:hypothetical protein